MNIVAPILNAIAYPTANLNTESAKRDNVQRETIPQTTDADQSASQKGLGSESDKARLPGQPPAPVTYERPQIQSELQAAFQNVFGQEKDNAQDESAGKQDAQDQQKSRQEAQQEQRDAQEIEQLKARDKEVRAHEQAHAATGGQYAGSPQYDYTTGPDNKRYATSGEVQIDISEAQSPEQTLRKMQQVRAAALAPAEPSAQDLKVAAEAAQKAVEARADINKEKRDSQNVDSAQTSPSNVASNQSSEETRGIAPKIPNLDEIFDEIGVDRPTRNLDAATYSAQRAQENAFDTSPTSRALNSNEADVQSSAGGLPEFNSEVMQARIGRIQSSYTSAYTPVREGLSLQA